MLNNKDWLKFVYKTKKTNAKPMIGALAKVALLFSWACSEWSPFLEIVIVGAGYAGFDEPWDATSDQFV